MSNLSLQDIKYLQYIIFQKRPASNPEDQNKLENATLRNEAFCLLHSPIRLGTSTARPYWCFLLHWKSSSG